MKGIFKISAFAISLLTLASCTSDDFLGGSNKSGKQELIVSVESPNGESEMRAAFVPNAMSAIWQKDDVFRVYDELNQKYDEFQFDGSAITIVGDKMVEKHAKAIFPGNMVYKAGWDRTNGVVATMEIPNEITLQDPVVEGKTTAYVSALPMWGDAKDETAENLKVDLKHLAAYTDITVYKSAGKQAATAIRVLALKDKDTSIPTTDALTNVEFEDTPLSGYFDAQLKDGGVLVADKTNPMTKDSYKSYVVVTLPATAASETHVYIPIIPNVAYKNLVIQYQAGKNDWRTFANNAGVYQGVTFPRNALIKTGLVIGDAPKKAKVTGLADLNKKLQAREGGQVTDGDFLKDGDVVDVEIADDCEIATDIDLQTLVLPSDISLTVNIKGEIKNATANLPLQITGGGTKNKVTLNVESGINGSNNIVVNTNKSFELTLAGTATCTDKDHYNKILVNQAKTVTFGNGDTAPFSTEMNVVVAAGTVNVDAGSGTIGAIDLSAAGGTNVINVTSGTVKAIGGTTPAAGNVNVAGGVVEALETTSGVVTVTAGVVGDVTTESGAITVKADDTVNSITTETGDVTITETVVNTVDVNGVVASFKLDGGSAANAKLAKIATLNVGEKGNVTVTSSGKAAVLKVNKNSKATLSFTSSLAGKSKDVKTSEIESGNIYTAAQLAGLTTGNYTLNAKTLDMGSKEWVPVNLSGNFTLAQASEIQNLAAPLFGTVSGTVTIGKDKNNVLKLSNSSITTKAADQGALAQVVSGDATIKFIEVSNATITGQKSDGTTAKNYGGLVGRVTGSVSLDNNVVTATITAYANAGGFIGNFAGTKFTATETNSNYSSNVTFKLTDDNAPVAPALTNAEAGTFGYFIGSVTKENAEILINQYVKNNTPTYGTQFTDYFSVTMMDTVVESPYTDGSKLGFANNKEVGADGKLTGKVFKGMTNHEIGYSPVTALKRFILYAEKDTQLGYEWSEKLETINNFEE